MDVVLQLSNCTCHDSKTKAADGPVSVLLKFHKFLQKTKQTNKQKTSQYWTINNWIVDFRYMNTPMMLISLKCTGHCKCKSTNLVFYTLHGSQDITSLPAFI